MSAGLNHGLRKGYFATIGLVLGIWAQLLVVGVGLGALLATSNTAFVGVKWAGVAYLVYLGVQQWRAPVRPLAELQAGAASVRRRDLVLLAVVPQFLELAQPLTAQYLVIGLTLGFTDLTVMAGYTALAAKVLGALKSARAMKWLNRVFGGLFVAAGVLLSVFKRAA